MIEQVEQWQRRFLDKFGTRLVYAADELYIKAGIELPSCEEYEEFPQIENGVGMMARFIYEFDSFLGTEGGKLDMLWKRQPDRTVSIATGRCAAGYIGKLARTLENRFDGLKINVYAIENEFLEKM